MFENLPKRILYFTEVWVYPNGDVVHKRSWSKTFGFVQPEKKKKERREEYKVEKKGVVEL